MDAMWYVTHLGRTYYHLAKPMIEHYKHEIIKVMLAMIREGKLWKLRDAILPALELAGCDLPELDVIQQSLNAGNNQVANEDREQHKKEEAQSTARRIGVDLHLLDHRQIGRAHV